MLDFALHRLPALDAVDSQCGMRRIERHPTDKAQAMGHPLVAVLTVIIGDAPRLFSLGHLRAQKSMIPLFDTQHRAPVMRVSRLHMRSIRAQTVRGDQHLEVGVIAAKLGDEALGSLAFAVIFLAAILFDHRLGHERNDCARVGVDAGPYKGRFLKSRRWTSLLTAYCGVCKDPQPKGGKPCFARPVSTNG